MENYFGIFEKAGKYAPIGLSEGILHSELNPKDPFIPLNSDSGDWRKLINSKVELPKELWFITKDKHYSFDLRHDSGGFFISNNLLQLFDKLNTTNFTSTKLHILNKQLQSVSDKQYQYVKFYGYEDMIDYENSKIDFDKNGVVKKIWTLKLKDSEIKNDIFMINSWIFNRRLFCSDKFKEVALQYGVEGLQFISADDAGVFKP